MRALFAAALFAVPALTAPAYAQSLKRAPKPIHASQHPVEQAKERNKQRHIAADITSAGVGALIGGLVAGPLGLLIGAFAMFTFMRGVRSVNEKFS